MYETLTLPNGLRVIWEEIPHVRSVSAGLWIGAGSRCEKAGESGACHFIEHMTFKGTARRTAADLARDMDAIGGQINAFTTKEYTCFYGRVLDEQLDTLGDILCDMFLNSRFDDADVESERGVICEEIDMYEDTPDDLVSEILFTSCFRGSSLSHPILGKKSTLQKFTGQSLRTFRDAHYTPDAVVVSLSGNLTRQDAERFAARLGDMQPRSRAKLRPAVYTPSVTVRRKRIEQNHICLGFPGISVEDETRYALQFAASILGGGMSSRLFQTLREKLGLCYTVYSFGSSYRGTGIEGVYAAVSRENEGKAISCIADEIRRLLDDGVPEDELRRCRDQMKSNVLMSLESTSARMNRLGKNVLMLGYMPEVDEIIRRVEEVTAEDVLAAARAHYGSGKVSLSAVGKVQTVEEYSALLEKHGL